jgi:hypothetical protein
MYYQQALLERIWSSKYSAWHCIADKFLKDIYTH